MKAVSILLILVGLAAMGMGLASAPSSAPNAIPLPKVAMRELGKVPAGSVAPEKAAPPPAEKAPRAEAPPANTGGKALGDALAKAQEKPGDEIAVPEKPVAKAPPAEKAPAPEKAAAPAEKTPPPPAEKAAAPEKAATGERTSAPPPAKTTAPAKAPSEKAAGPTANPYDGAEAAAPAAMGILNLRASDTADVYVDGKKAGGSPLKGYKVKPGKHKVRFDCYQPSGETKPGTTQSYDVAADAERDVDYECPAD